ncbi:hypothetical protein BD413DRAFT_576316 [Trametes elegans]|nr:hypothetical protein BD413DRAFT_576316 [Trametes elegans]
MAGAYCLAFGNRIPLYKVGTGDRERSVGYFSFSNGLWTVMTVFSGLLYTFALYYTLH